MASGSFELGVRDTNSGKDLDAPGLSFCARYNRDGDGNSGAGPKIHVFTKQMVGEMMDTSWGTSWRCKTSCGTFSHFETSWGLSCRTSCGTFPHFGTSCKHLAGHLAGHSLTFWDILGHLAGHLGDILTFWDVLRDILRTSWGHLVWETRKPKTF